jgi:flagellar protein FlaG
MVHEISTKLAPIGGQTTPAFQQPVSQPAKQELGIAQEKPSVALAPVKKAEIKVDPIEMQKSLSQSIERLNQMMLQNGRNLSFSIDPSLEIPIITVKNEETGEVVRQIPTQAVVQVAHNFDALKGILLNAKI